MIPKDVLVIDNIINQQEQKHIKDNLLSSNFPWYFVKDITTGKEGGQNRPALQHIYFQNKKENSLYCGLTNNIIKNSCEKIKKTSYKIVKSRSFLQFPILHNSQIDTPHIDLLSKHIVILYYVLDSDGDTVIYNYKSKKIPAFNKLKEKIRVTPKQGRVVIFNGLTWHTAEQPSRNVRCVTNINLV